MRGPGTGMGLAGLHSPTAQSMAALESLGTEMSPGATETGRHNPECPHIPGALGTGQGSGWDTAPRKYMGLGQHITSARAPPRAVIPPVLCQLHGFL